MTNDGVMGYDRVNRIARNHKVTFMVVARQAFDKGLLASDDFFGLYRQHKAIVDSVEGKPKRSSTGIRMPTNETGLERSSPRRFGLHTTAM